MLTGTAFQPIIIANLLTLRNRYFWVTHEYAECKLFIKLVIK